MTQNFNGFSINIETEVPKIPIKIGALQYEFSLSDENITTFRTRHAEVAAELESIADTDNEEDAMEIAKKALKTGFDAVLGDGAFEDLYKQSPSVIYLMEYFQKLAVGLNEAMAQKNIVDPTLNRYQRRNAKKK